MKTIVKYSIVFLYVCATGLTIAQDFVSEWEYEQHEIVQQTLHDWIIEGKSEKELSNQLLAVTRMGVNISTITGEVNSYLSHSNNSSALSGLLEVWIINHSRPKLKKGFDPTIFFENRTFEIVDNNTFTP